MIYMFGEEGIRTHAKVQVCHFACCKGNLDTAGLETNSTDFYQPIKEVSLRVSCLGDNSHRACRSSGLTSPPHRQTPPLESRYIIYRDGGVNS